MNTYFAPSELIINDDGSCFHLHLKPEQLADKVILVGDPDRVDTIAAMLDSLEYTVSNREFRTATGQYNGKRITIQSTGIGCDNIDIVMNELDTLANIDYSTRTEKPVHRTLDIVRIGTCGGLQPYTPLGTYLCSVKSIGFDGLLNYYAGRDAVCDLEFERAFVAHMEWSTKKGAPYVANANPELLKRIMDGDKKMVPGVTIACGGFYGPQGRVLRAKLSDPNQNAKVESFEYNGYRITNYEMESSAVAGMAAILGHRAMTVCMVIANRYAKEMNTDYKPLLEGLITRVLDRI
ncbi:MAG: nucleoside phosphorylase [Bacteroidaceae bacterium]|nr:nucleoside phosphorylase [Bacteroidaceae bacterium]